MAGSTSRSKLIVTTACSWLCSALACLLFTTLLLAVSSRLFRSSSPTGVGVVNEVVGALLGLLVPLGLMRVLLGGRTVSVEELRAIPRSILVWFVCTWILSISLRLYSGSVHTINWLVPY